jgi:extracellular elastinolytic metalloproteinase
MAAMSRELDRRDFTESQATADRQAELSAVASEVSDDLPGEHRVRVTKLDATTGNPAVVVSDRAPVDGDDYVLRGLAHLQTIGPVLGLTGGTAEFQPDPAVQETSSGSVAAHFQQKYKGIRVFEAAQVVRFAPDGAIEDAAGSSITVVRDVSAAPGLTVVDAVMRAAEQVATPDQDEAHAVDQFGEPLHPHAVNLDGFRPAVRSMFVDYPERPTVLTGGPFGHDIRANLTWFPLGEDVVLCWEVLLRMPAGGGQYRVLVDAGSGEIMYCRQLTRYVAARGNVYRRDGGSPREMCDFPLPVNTYGLPVPANLPAGFPEDLVTEDRTVGNCTSAHLDDAGHPVCGEVRDGVLTFDFADPVGNDQRVLNIFYFCCYMHDYFYLLGFRESDGNFQTDNLGRGGAASDAVEARSYGGPVAGTASMETSVDGRPPIMRMGLVSSTNRHTALDSSVVFHEFTHGVSNRLIGGRQNDHALESPQSGGMGEGWSDYTACTVNGSTVVGTWVVNRPEGIRGFPYDPNFPDHFGRLGTGRYTEVHNIGEVWCATLLELNRRIGANPAMQLVVDSFKLMPANPSFLNARDAMLTALDHQRQSGQLTESQWFATWRQAWSVFAHFGMGPGARCNGAQLSGVVADFTLPRLQGFVLETGTALAETDATVDFLVGEWTADGRPDLFAIKRSGTASGSTEVQILSGADNFQSFVLQSGTALPETDAAYTFALADWTGDGRPDLFAIRRSGTASGNVEVQVLSGGDKFQSFVLQTATALPVTDASVDFLVTDWTGDGRPDLVAVQRAGTGTTSTEVRILSGADQFQSLVLQTGTALPETDESVAFALADWTGDGRPDLVAIMRSATGTGSTEVHVLSGGDRFQSFATETGTALPQTDGTYAFAVSDWSRTGRPDLIAVKRSGTGTHSTEVHIVG